jgi:hypothetical protein
MLPVLNTAGLFVVAAVAEILGRFLPSLWFRKGATPWLLIPAALSLAVFAWLLTLHPTAACFCDNTPLSMSVGLSPSVSVRRPTPDARRTLNL